jgi:hypothetical protein
MRPPLRKTIFDHRPVGHPAYQPKQNRARILVRQHCYRGERGEVNLPSAPCGLLERKEKNERVTGPCRKPASGRRLRG